MDNIVSYIAVQLANPTVAANFLNEVEKCYGYLKSNPLIYERRHDAYLEKVGYYKAIIRNYVLVYKVDEAAKAVTVYINRLTSEEGGCAIEISSLVMLKKFVYNIFRLGKEAGFLCRTLNPVRT